jgi:hypothetical protein
MRAAKHGRLCFRVMCQALIGCKDHFLPNLEFSYQNIDEEQRPHQYLADRLGRKSSWVALWDLATGRASDIETDIVTIPSDRQHDFDLSIIIKSDLNLRLTQNRGFRHVSARK